MLWPNRSRHEARIPEKICLLGLSRLKLHLTEVLRSLILSSKSTERSFHENIITTRFGSCKRAVFQSAGGLSSVSLEPHVHELFVEFIWSLFAQLISPVHVSGALDPFCERGNGKNLTPHMLGQPSHSLTSPCRTFISDHLPFQRIYVSNEHMKMVSGPSRGII
jgi:hypothetical protein